MAQEVLTERTGYVNESILEGKSIRPGCLGQLRGPICEWKNPTRNDHYYTQSLWRRVFNLPWVKEAMKTRTLFGEADHPEDRLESNLSKTAVVLVDYQERPEDMDYIGTFDILDTPSGRIVKTLAEYGCELGVSSRGRGSLTKINGRNTVDEASYVFGGFDIVALPAVKKARHQFFHESVQFKSVKQDIQTQINECQSIDELNIIKSILENSDYGDLVDNINSKISNLSESISRSADNTIVEGLTKDLRRAYDKINELESAQSVNTIDSRSSESQIADAQLLITTLAENNRYLTQLGDLREELYKLRSENDKLSQQASRSICDPTSTNEEELDESRYINESDYEDDQALIQQLLDENQELQDVINHLKSTPNNDSGDQSAIIAELQGTIRSKSARIDKLVEELDDVYYVNQELSNEVDALSESYDRTRDKLVFVARRHNKLADILEQTEQDTDNKISDLEAYCETLKSTLLKSKKSLASLEDHLQEMTEDSQASDDQHKMLLDQLEITEQELADAHDTLDNLQRDYDDATRYITKMHQNYDMLKESLNEVRRDSANTIAELESSYEEALSDLDQEVSDSKKTISQCNRTIRSLNQQVADNDELIDQYDQALSNSQAKIEDYQDRIGDYKTQLDDMTSELSYSNSELDLTKQKLSITRDNLEMTRSELDQAQKDLNDTQAELESVQVKLDMTRSALQTTKDELSMSQDELEAATNELSDTQDELNLAHQELGRHKKLIRDLADDNQDLQDELADTKTRASRIRRKLVDSHEAEVNEYAEEIDQLNDDLDEVSDQLSAYKSKYKSLLDAHRELKSEYDLVVAELGDLKTEYSESLREHEKALNRVSGRYNRVKNELTESTNYILQLESELKASSKQASRVQAELHESMDMTNDKASRLQNSYDELVDNYNELLTENSVLRLSYLSQQANKIGVSSSDMVNMLPKEFSVKDIDAIVESHLSRKKRESSLSITSPKLDDSQQITTIKAKTEPINENLSSTQKTLIAMKLATKK